MQPDTARRAAQPSLKTITIMHHKGSLRRSNLVPGIIKMSCSPRDVCRSQPFPAVHPFLDEERPPPPPPLRCRRCIPCPFPSQSLHGIREGRRRPCSCVRGSFACALGLRGVFFNLRLGCFRARLFIRYHSNGIMNERR